MARSKLSIVPSGWVDYNRRCPTCKAYNPEYARVCQICGQRIVNVIGVCKLPTKKNKHKHAKLKNYNRANMLKIDSTPKGLK